MGVENENVVSKEWVRTNQKVIASWSVFHLIWSINHDLAIRSANLFELARKQGVTEIEQNNMLVVLETKSKLIKEAYEYLSEKYVTYHFARLSHERASEQGEAYTAALDAIGKIRECLQVNATEIDKVGKDFSQGKYGFVNNEQKNLLEVAFGFSRGLLTILSVINTWISSKGLGDLFEG